MTTGSTETAAPGGRPGGRPCLPPATAAAMSFFGVSLLCLLHDLACYAGGGSFGLLHGLMEYRQCVWGVLFGLSGVLFHLSGAGAMLWGGCLAVAGLSPFATWLLFAPGSAYLEINAGLLAAALLAALHGYLGHVQEVRAALGLGRPSAFRRLLRAKLVLYGMAVPLGSFAGSCLVSGGFRFRGLLRQMLSIEYRPISRPIAALAALVLLFLAADTAWLLLRLAASAPAPAGRTPGEPGEQAAEAEREDP